MKDGTKCPLIKDYCMVSTCAFWAYTKKYIPEKKEYVNDEGYCIVRDFMLSLIAKASY